MHLSASFDEVTICYIHIMNMRDNHLTKLQESSSSALVFNMNVTKHSGYKGIEHIFRIIIKLFL